MKIVRGPARLVRPQELPRAGLPSVVPLSASDLVVPRVHVEVLYAFEAPAPPVSLLESGLATVLSEYREWAGRLSKDQNGRPVIELSDEGAVLIEAEASGEVREMMPFNPSRLLLELIPVNRGVPELLLIQVTKFACGGMTVGVARHHQVADGQAAGEFMNAWASVVKGLHPPFYPMHDRSDLMARDPPQPVFDHIEYKRPAPKSDVTVPSEYPELAIKKFHFNIDLLKKLKAKAVEDATENAYFTTFESLMAHLWKKITIARGLEGQDIEMRTLVAVNARKRLKPSLPQEYFGNVMCHTCPVVTVQDLLQRPLSFVASCIHNAIIKIKTSYVRSAFDFVELQQKNPVQIARTNRTVLSPNLSVTSWVHLPLYELDFGFGTPVFAGNPFIPFEGLVVIAPAPSYAKDGSLDVVLGLFAPDMARLEEICFSIDY